MIERIRRRGAGFAFAAVLTGCASARSTRPADNATMARRRDSKVIGADEIAANNSTNLYDLVRALRPEWFWPRGAGGETAAAITTGRGGAAGGAMETPIQVYMDTQRIGSIDMLQNMGLSGVATLKYYSPSEAQATFGRDNASGAIQIISARGLKPSAE